MQMTEMLTHPLDLLLVFSLLSEHSVTIDVSPARERAQNIVNCIHPATSCAVES
jgi:hypothetical protein